MHKYIAVAHHKSGVYVMGQLWELIFFALGATTSDMGMWIQPCYPHTCYSPEAPIQIWVDMYSYDKAQEERVAAGANGMRVVGIVRDPVSMIVSAYCYHHRGKELDSILFFPAALLVVLGPKEGLKLVAEGMLPAVENMTSAFEQPSHDTFRLEYEKLTRSSDGFDQQMGEMMNFLFQDLITPAERSQVLNATKWADLHRHPPTDDHQNNQECEDEVRKYVPSLPADILSRYRSFQERLGYAAT